METEKRRRRQGMVLATLGTDDPLENSIADSQRTLLQPLENTVAELTLQTVRPRHLCDSVLEDDMTAIRRVEQTLTRIRQEIVSDTSSFNISTPRRILFARVFQPTGRLSR